MNIISNILIGLIKFYKMVISPYLTPSCRCHPIKILGGGEGFDPVNKELKVKK